MRFSSVAENSKKMSRSKEPMGLASCALADKPRAACRAKPTEAFVPDGEEDRGLGKLGGERSHGVQSGECRVQNTGGEYSKVASGIAEKAAFLGMTYWRFVRISNAKLFRVCRGAAPQNIPWSCLPPPRAIGKPGQQHPRCGETRRRYKSLRSTVNS